jgi:hypothetical protein
VVASSYSGLVGNRLGTIGIDSAGTRHSTLTPTVAAVVSVAGYRYLS